MFWKKKEKITTKMYKRIEKLYNMMKYLEMRNFYTLPSVDYECEYKTKLGDRVFSISPKVAYCEHGIEVNKYFTVTFGEYIKVTKKFFILNEKEKIFSLDVYKDETKIQPCPISLTAHEIDLAILEFENYINKIYTEHKAKQEELSEV